MIVSLCCNDPDNGQFTGRLVALDYSDLELRHDDWFRGCVVRYLGDGKVRISRRVFTFERHKEWYGNWAWDGVWMRRQEAKRLLRYLRDSGAWTCEAGPSRLYDWFNAPRPQTIPPPHPADAQAPA
jgi:hypothetical protein